MLFNSFEFLIFFPVVFLLYLILDHKWQNRLLLAASCLFYASWNWKFLFLMFVSISTDYWCSRRIHLEDDPRKRRWYLALSIFVNLAILGFFKYYNFFAANLQDLLQAFHLISPSVDWTLKIILPLGISFYTFEAISYVVDVYHRRIEPKHKYWDYVLFVIYFPHLIAGPIMRAKEFIPQITAPRILRLEQFYEGCHLFFWGLFEKVFIADNLGKIVNPVFAAPGPYEGGQVLLALYAFAFQIFCDFDGYSNMARGLAKCMGFELTINFKLPYFAADPREFWQRWHISLSSWLRDYIYIALGGNRRGEVRAYINLFITMFLGGLWHGASWTFVLWGVYHGAVLGIHRFMRSRSAQSTVKPAQGPAWRILKTVLFFHVIVFGWLLFRATSLSQVGEMLYAVGGIFQANGSAGDWAGFLLIILPLLAVQWGQFKTNNLMFLFKLPKVLKIAIYSLMTYLILGFGVMRAEEFIYFQF